MQIFDTHCHYNLEPLFSGKKQYFSSEQLKLVSDKKWQDHWDQAKLQGVVATLIPGTSLETSQQAISISQNSPKLFASIGIHPSDGVQLEFPELEKKFIQLAQLANDPKVVAIGETGLDYFHLSKQNFDKPKSAQGIFLLFQIQIQSLKNFSFVQPLSTNHFSPDHVMVIDIFLSPH